MNQWQLILQWSDLTTAVSGNKTGECCRFENLSLVEPVHIAIVPDTGLEKKAEMLYQLLRSRISSLARPRSGSTHTCPGPRLLECLGRNEPTCRSILLVVCSTNRVSHQVETAMNNWMANCVANPKILPMLPGGANINTVLPSGFDQIAVLRDTNGIEACVPEIFRCAGLASDQFRLFISYRRNDSAKLADQLFDRFSREGFDVFLDRFRGTPGRAFPNQLSESLIDKGLVLVIESANVWQSNWTIAEVLFAYIYRLGLLSISPPGGSAFELIDDRNRYRGTLQEWVDPYGCTVLSDPGLNQFVSFVRERYAEQIMVRRVYLESLLGNALATCSLSAKRELNGIHSVSNADGYCIELSSRQPKLENIYRVSKSISSTSQSAVVVGPREFLDPQSKLHLDWLIEKTNIFGCEEVRMLDLAKRIEAGNRLP